LKKSCVVFIIWKHYFGFLLDALFGLTWRMLDGAVLNGARKLVGG
jgi:hypothetical protein